METIRKATKEIFLGNLKIGGGAPISVQSMTKTDTRDTEATINQINELTAVGCEIVRIAVKDFKSVESLKKIISTSEIPVVADIHFDYRLALEALRAGVQGVRLNPGNIGSERKIEQVVKAARERKVPIRVGVNAGSLEKSIKYKYGGTTPKALVESALEHVSLIEKFGYDQIKISIKASDVLKVIDSYKILSNKVSYPLHLGVTEAGAVLEGSIKSALALGVLLSEGIGDTIRVSLTGSPVEEVRAAYLILGSLGLRENRNIELISCPTCGRCEWDLVETVREIESKIKDNHLPIKVAVMGCVVNGPGEAEEADIGIAGAKNGAVLFKKGEVVRKVSREEIVDALIYEIEKMKDKY